MAESQLLMKLSAVVRTGATGAIAPVDFENGLIAPVDLRLYNVCSTYFLRFRGVQQGILHPSIEIPNDDSGRFCIKNIQNNYINERKR